MSCNKYRNSASVLALAVSATCALPASAANFSYDMRCVSGPAGSDVGVSDPVHERDLVTGLYQLELWVRVKGTNGTVTDEALSACLISAASTQVNGGAVLSGGLSNGQTSGPFNDASTSRNGAANDLTSDGIMDWGGTSFNRTDTTYMFARTSLGPSGGQPAGGSIGVAIDANTWAFKIATFDFNATSVASAAGYVATEIGAIKPRATFGGSTLTPAVYITGKIDNITTNISNANAASSGTYSESLPFVMHNVPEPGAAFLISTASVALLARRGKTARR
jgi:hypothetical protein